jgi:hypothetical protein
MGQQAPRTATAHNIREKDAVQYLPLGVCLGTPSRFGLGYQIVVTP